MCNSHDSGVMLRAFSRARKQSKGLGRFGNCCSASTNLPHPTATSLCPPRQRGVAATAFSHSVAGIFPASCVLLAGVFISSAVFMTAFSFFA